MLLIGTDGDDVINGTNKSDLIIGLKGNDWLAGGNDDDLIYGNEGNDEVLGENGDDWLEGGDGVDHVYGGNGSDVVVGGKDGDQVNGGNGNDSIAGGLGRDINVGGNGNDVFSFGAKDSLVGQWNRDFVLDFHQGEDSLFAFGADWSTTAGPRTGISPLTTLMSLDFDHNGTVDGEVLFVGAITFTADDFIAPPA
jgi:Ca2+-binding RTX toxin-like protein